MSRSSPVALSRRTILAGGGAALVVGAIGPRAVRAAAPAPAQSSLKLPHMQAPTESEGEGPPELLAPSKRVGFAIVGLGHLALEQILPAFGESKRCRVTALVSGDRAKATVVAGQHGIDPRHIYDYKTYDRLRDDADVDVVYVVLPNGMHAEYTVRAAQAGKHVLCEKPMANSVAECQQMIDASQRAGKKLMIAYRMQYEPYNREAIRLARSGELGALKSFTASNGQAQGDPNQWRLKRTLSGGGALVDVGIYCLNAARYLSGEEPSQVAAFQHSTAKDPRFREVEEQVDFLLRFPSGLQAVCTSSYGLHDSKRFRLAGESAWVEMDPAFPYHGQQMRIGRKSPAGEGEQIEQRVLPAKNQFALEMDHLATCIQSGKRPRTPGEEGQQDVRIMTAIYQAAQSGQAIKLPSVDRRDAFRGDAA
jgi:predicted dehydrogenase